jgi:hypothetical protein
MARTYKRRGTVRKTRKRGGMPISTNEFNAAWKERQMNQPSASQYFEYYKQRAADFDAEQAKLKEAAERRNTKEEEKRRVLEEELLRSSPPKNTTQKKKKKKPVIVEIPPDQPKQDTEYQSKQQTPKATNEEQKADERTPEEQLVEKLQQQPKKRNRQKSNIRKDKIEHSKQSKLLKLEESKITSLLSPITDTYDFTQWDDLKIKNDGIEHIFHIPKSFTKINVVGVLVNPTETQNQIISDALQSILTIYGTLTRLFLKYKCGVVIKIKGTRASELATRSLIETLDVDAVIIDNPEPIDKQDADSKPIDKEIVAKNIAKLIVYIIGDQRIGMKQVNTNGIELYKLSVKISNDMFIAISDLMYIDTSLVENVYDTYDGYNLSYIFPNFESLISDKLAFFKKYNSNMGRDNQGKEAIKKGLCKMIPFLTKNNIDPSTKEKILLICGIKLKDYYKSALPVHKYETPDSDYGTPDSIPSSSA